MLIYIYHNILINVKKKYYILYIFVLIVSFKTFKSETDAQV